MPRVPPQYQETPPTVAQEPKKQTSSPSAPPYPDPVPVTHIAVPTLNELLDEPADKPTFPIVREPEQPKPVELKQLSRMSREDLIAHLKGMQSQFKQPVAHASEEKPRPQLTERQRQQLELETKRGAERVAYHASEAARFKMPPRAEVQSGRTNAPVVEPHTQPIGRTEEQREWVPKRVSAHGKAEGENGARAVGPGTQGVISGV